MHKQSEQECFVFAGRRAANEEMMFTEYFGGNLNELSGKKINIYLLQRTFKMLAFSE